MVITRLSIEAFARSGSGIENAAGTYNAQRDSWAVCCNGATGAIVRDSSFTCIFPNGGAKRKITPEPVLSLTSSWHHG